MRDYLADRRYRKQRLSRIESKVGCICMASPWSDLNGCEILQDWSARIAGLEISEHGSEGREKYGKRDE